MDDVDHFEAIVINTNKMQWIIIIFVNAGAINNSFYLN